MELSYSLIKEEPEIEKIFDQVIEIRSEYNKRTDYKAICKKYKYTDDFGYYISNFNKRTIETMYKNIIKFIISLIKEQINASFVKNKIKKKYPEPPFDEIGLQLVNRFFEPLITQLKKNKQTKLIKKIKEKSNFLD